MKTPHATVKEVLVGLATNDFEGLKATEFWPFVTELCGDLDEFTKTVVWSWLLKEPDFEVLRAITDDEYEGQPEDKKKTLKQNFILEKKDDLPDFESFFSDANIEDYTIKISDDYQSIYLTGLKQKDNKLGRMPYDLLRVIAKHKTSGINSIDLVKEANQDSRSLTTRLQVLEDNLLIIKFPVCVNKFNTNHMIHFRFTNINSINNKNGEDDDPSVMATMVGQPADSYYDRAQVIVQIMDALKAESTHIRLTRDLFEEIKQFQPVLKSRWFNKILQFLVSNNYIELIQVEHAQLKRFFPAIRYLKDLPNATRKNELLDAIKEQGNMEDDGDEDVEDNDEENMNDDEEDEFDHPRFNRFCSLTVQSHNLIEKNPGIMLATIDRELTGIYRSKSIHNIVESTATVSQDPQNPNGIIAQMFQTGKLKFYRFTVQDTLNKRNPDFKAEIKNVEIPEASRTSLFEESVLYGSQTPIDRRLKFIEVKDNFDNDKYFLIQKGYSGKIGLKIANTIASRLAFEGNYETKDGLIKLNVKKSKISKIEKEIELYKKNYDLDRKSVIEYNKSIEHIHNKLEELKKFSNSITSNVFQDFQDSKVDNFKNKSDGIIMDYGPEYRRKTIKEILDKEKCICLNNDFSARLSQYLKLDYKIDRRTIIRDGANLVSNKLAELENVGSKIVLKSIENPPNEDDINKSIQDVRVFTSRTYTAQVKLEDIPVRDESTLRRGLKFANKESRLKSAMEKLKNASQRKPLARKAKMLSSNEAHEITDEELDEDVEMDDETVQSSNAKDDKYTDGKDEDDDSFEPIMGDRKRKKFVRNINKSEVRVVKAFKKIRKSIRITNDHILILIKAIIVTQSLSNSGNIDWPKVSVVLENLYDPDTLRRQWPRHRKMLGPRNLLAAKKNWENALLTSISNGVIKEEDLEDYDIFKLLDVWKVEGADMFLSISEREISKNYEDNFKKQVFKPLRDESGPEILREPLSIVEKEQVWTNRNFMYKVNYEKEHWKLLKECARPSKIQIARTKLMALFATNSEKFDSNKVRELFSVIPKQLYSEALTELENSKAIAFLGEDSKIKFTLTDRIMLTLDCKLDDEFVHNAKDMVESLNNAKNTNSGLILSTRCPSGGYVPIFSSFFKDNLKITRIDRSIGEVDTYITKSRDRGKLESDFILSDFKDDKSLISNKVTVPIDPPCSYLWIDLNGDFNEKLWHKCIYTIIWSIVFNPGLPLEIMCIRVRPLLEPFEVKRILDWLILRGNIETREFGGYWPSECWFDIK